MNTFKLMAVLGFGALVSACSNVPDIASRNAPFEAIPTAVYQQSGAKASSMVTTPLHAMRVEEVNVVVPRALKVSEANVYYPRGDIVWRGEPVGDRHTQIKSIFEAGAYNATKDMVGQTPVVIDMEVVRFHSLSERARATIGGVHNMSFRMTVRDATTGLPIGLSRDVVADLPAYGGNQAVQAERRGQTQKIRVTGFLAQVIRQELETPSVAEVEAKPAPRHNADI